MGSSERNFTISMQPCTAYVTKVGDPANPNLAARALQEQAALALATEHCPDVPPRYLPINETNAIGVKVERLTNLGRVSTDTMIDTIDRLQTIPHSDTLPTFNSGHYRDQPESHADYLLSIGAFRGLTSRECDYILARTGNLADAIHPFGTTFVHTDIQRRHFGTSPKDGRIKLFDFDQAHFGNELEDFAFLSTRHPRAASKVQAHLEAKFADEPNKAILLKDALEFMHIHFLLKAMVDRTVQSRGRPFDVAARFYGRLALGLGT